MSATPATIPVRLSRFGIAGAIRHLRDDLEATAELRPVEDHHEAYDRLTTRALSLAVDAQDLPGTSGYQAETVGHLAQAGHLIQLLYHARCIIELGLVFGVSYPIQAAPLEMWRAVRDSLGKAAAAADLWEREEG